MCYIGTGQGTSDIRKIHAAKFEGVNKIATEVLCLQYGDKDILVGEL